MANDLGGRAKTLYSLDDGTTTSDLLGADTARAESMSNDYSKLRAKIWITSDGKVGYDVNTVTFQDTIQSLAAGEHLTDLFTYAIRLGNGTLSWATTYIDFVGVNDAPVVTSGDFARSVVELNPSDPDLLANGVIHFSDLDLSDSHTASMSPAAGNLGSLSIMLGETAGSGTGQVSWQYSVSNAAVDYLAAGEIKEDKFKIMIDDGHGGVVEQEVKILITGTNDAPIITSPMSSGMADEQKDPVGDIVVNSPANILFSDVDLSDHHSISVIADSNNLADSSLVAMLVNDTTGSGMGGEVSWQYSVAASAVEYLAAGESRVEKFIVSVNDGHGGIASQDVWITVNGTNDAPIITSPMTSGMADEQMDPVGNIVVNSSANIRFNDVDLSNHHTISAIADPNTNNLAGSSLAVMLVSDTTGSGMGGQVSWQYSVAASAAEYLAVGEFKVEKFTVSINDGHGGIASQDVLITINGTNDASTGSSTMGTLDVEDSPLIISAAALLQGFSDRDVSDVLSLSNLNASHGQLIQLNNGDYQFTPDPNFYGIASLSYDVIDGHGGVAQGHVDMNIIQVNHPPVITSPEISCMVDEQKDPVGNIEINSDPNQDVSNHFIFFKDLDLDDDFHHLSVLADQSNLIGSSFTLQLYNEPTSFNPIGEIRWQYSVAASAAEYLAEGESKLEKFTVSITDKNGGVASQDVSIIINGTNDAPTGSSTVGPLNGAENTPLIISAADLLLGFSDRDASDVLSLSNLIASHGQLTPLFNGDYQFTPDLNFFGATSLSYDVIDGHGGVAQGNVNMNIAPVIENNHAPSLTGSFHDFTANSFKFTVQDQDYAQGDIITANLPANMQGLSSSVASLGGGLFDVTISGLGPQTSILSSPISVQDSSGAVSGTFQLVLGTGGDNNLASNISSPISGDIVAYGFGGSDSFDYWNEWSSVHYLLGGDGNDILNGILWSTLNITDMMTGGSGADKFKFSTTAAVLVGGSIDSGDVITDFQKGSDVIDLSGVHVSSGNLASGNVAVTYNGPDATISIYTSTTLHDTSHLRAQILVNNMNNLSIGTDIIL